MVQLPPMPDRIAALPRDHRGYPVPWFVEWIDGKPQFPIMNNRKRERAVKEGICWVCGERMGNFEARTFVVGPMCGINRVSSEPPCHFSCAEFAVQACPFLVNPNMKRIENEHTKQGASPGGIMIERNPGVSLLWTTKKFRTFSDGRGGWLIRIGDPRSIQFWKEGRRATEEEILASIETGCPILLQHCVTDEQKSAFADAKAKFLGIVQRMAA